MVQDCPVTASQEDIETLELLAAELQLKRAVSLVPAIQRVTEHAREPQAERQEEQIPPDAGP
jgi:hypothetical protein